MYCWLLGVTHPLCLHCSGGLFRGSISDRSRSRTVDQTVFCRPPRPACLHTQFSVVLFFAYGHVLSQISDMSHRYLQRSVFQRLDGQVLSVSQLGCRPMSGWSYQSVSSRRPSVKIGPNRTSQSVSREATAQALSPISQAQSVRCDNPHGGH